MLLNESRLDHAGRIEWLNGRRTPRGAAVGRLAGIRNVNSGGAEGGLRVWSAPKSPKSLLCESFAGNHTARKKPQSQRLSRLIWARSSAEPNQEKAPQAHNSAWIQATSGVSTCG